MNKVDIIKAFGTNIYIFDNKKYKNEIINYICIRKNKYDNNFTINEEIIIIFDTDIKICVDYITENILPHCSNKITCFCLRKIDNNFMLYDDTFVEYFDNINSIVENFKKFILSEYIKFIKRKNNIKSIEFKYPKYSEKYKDFKFDEKYVKLDKENIYIYSKNNNQIKCFKDKYYHYKNSVLLIEENNNIDSNLFNIVYFCDKNSINIILSELKDIILKTEYFNKYYNANVIVNYMQKHIYLIIDNIDIINNLSYINKMTLLETNAIIYNSIDDCIINIF